MLPASFQEIGMNAIAIASAGMLSAATQFDAASARVVQAVNGGSEDPATPIVDQISSLNQFRASASTLKTANAMFKTLLDIKV
jgi:hypothetical protein